MIGVKGTGKQHGTVAGYSAGCRKACCRRAATRLRKATKLDHMRGIPREVDATGTIRRLQALAVMGWPFAIVGADLGISKEAVNQTLRRKVVRVATANRVAAVYAARATRFGPSVVGRRRAIARGWVSPAAWDNIDDPGERPKGVAHIIAVARARQEYPEQVAS